MLSAKIAEHLFAHQVEAHFAEHRFDYVQVVLYRVVLKNADLAMELFYSLQEDELTFAEMARQYATRPEEQRSGGYQGVISGKDLKAAIAPSVFSASPPEVLRPIRHKRKVYLVYVEEMTQPVLDAALRSQIQAELLTNWLKQQTEKALAM